jgi:hypothetical protein
MVKDFGEYLLVFLDKWFFWVGIVFLIPELLKKFPKTKEVAEKLPHKLFWILGAFLIFVASFQAWREQHEKVRAGRVELKGTFTPIFNEIVRNGEPVSMNMAWEVFGSAPALEPHSDGKIYLISDVSPDSQNEKISDFEHHFGELSKRVELGEYASMWPNDPKPAFSTITNDDVVTDREEIIRGDKIIIIIAANRFKDAAGIHEAHACKWVVPPPKQGFAEFTLHNCVRYVTQIDISKN